MGTESATATETKAEWVKCNACGADEFRELAVLDGWHVGECGKCSLIYTNPMPFHRPDEGFRDLAEEFFYTECQKEIVPAKVELAEKQFTLQMREASRLTGMDVDKGRFLDIGCGPGLWVKAAAKAEWEATGIDIDSELVKLGRERFGTDLRCSDIFAANFDADSFNFVTMKFVMEHLSNPLDTLTEIKRILKPGGAVLIIVPNEGGLLNQMKIILRKNKTNWRGTMNPPHHLHGYAPDTMKPLLKRAGLAPLMIKPVTPQHMAYASSDQVTEMSVVKRLRGALWLGVQLMGRGSLLVAFAGKNAEERADG